MENNPKVTIISVIVVMVLVLGGMYYMQNRSPGITNVPRPGAPLPEGPNLSQRFEDFLNAFLKDVHDGMDGYRKEKKVLVEALNPDNLRTPAYVEENYAMVQKLVPSLRQRMSDVIKIFEDAETKVDELLLNQPEKVRKSVLQKWTELKRNQGKAYIDYFTFENDILNAYEALMTYYYEKRSEFEVDMKTGDVIFKNPADGEKAKELQDRIKTLTEQQREALQASQPDQSEKKN